MINVKPAAKYKTMLVPCATRHKNGMQLQGNAVAQTLKTVDATSVNYGIKISNFAALVLIRIVQDAKENGT